MTREDLRKRLFAKGRMKTGERNRSEIAYEQQVLEPALQSGEIQWYSFDGIKLRLAGNTFLTVDYAVLTKYGYLEMHDVKGHKRIYMEDAKVKMKVAAEMYPFTFKVAFGPSGGWQIEEVG
jgi:hypothetical protein